MPDWRMSDKGTRVRVALWLISEVGVGHIFTKSALREAFPGVEQVDRRMRDLRTDGWEIHTNLQDPTLAPDELRFVRAGGDVWDRSEPSLSKATGRRVSAKERQSAFRRDDYTCRLCGISVGEAYFDDQARRAVLTVTSNSDARDELWTVCTLCESGHVPSERPSEGVLAQAGRLSSADRFVIRVELESGRPTRDALVVRRQMWGLSEDQRESLRLALTDRNQD